MADVLTPGPIRDDGMLHDPNQVLDPLADAEEGVVKNRAKVASLFSSDGATWFSPMITLAIETSTPQGSVAALEDSRIIFSERFDAGRSLGFELFACLRRAGESVTHCDKIAVGLGPGSYSGVRIAIAAAVGLISGEGRRGRYPSILALETPAQHYISAGDARRANFYYARIQDGECVEGPMLLDAGGLARWVDRTPTCLSFVPAPFAPLPDAAICFPSAERLARMAELDRGIFSG